MAFSVQVTKVRRVASTGHIYVQWSDGSESEFTNLAAAKEWAQDIDTAEARETLRKLIARWYFLRDPTGATPSLVEGKTMTLDLQAATMLTVL